MNVKELKPLRDVTIVLATPKETKTSSGIVVASKLKDADKPSEGVVLAKGPDAEMLSINDTVAFTTDVIREDVVDGKTYLWMTTKNILGVVKKG